MYYIDQFKKECEENPICMECLSPVGYPHYESYDGRICEDCIKDYIKKNKIDDLKEAIESNPDDFIEFYYDEEIENKNTKEALWEHLTAIFESKKDERKTHVIEKMIEFCFEDIDYYLKVLNIDKVSI